MATQSICHIISSSRNSHKGASMQWLSWQGTSTRHYRLQHNITPARTPGRHSKHSPISCYQFHVSQQSTTLNCEVLAISQQLLVREALQWHYVMTLSTKSPHCHPCQQKWIESLTTKEMAVILELFLSQWHRDLTPPLPPSIIANKLIWNEGRIKIIYVECWQIIMGQSTVKVRPHRASNTEHHKPKCLWTSILKLCETEATMPPNLSSSQRKLHCE